MKAIGSISVPATCCDEKYATAEAYHAWIHAFLIGADKMMPLRQGAGGAKILAISTFDLLLTLPEADGHARTGTL